MFQNLHFAGTTLVPGLGSASLIQKRLPILVEFGTPVLHITNKGCHNFYTVHLLYE